MSQILVKYSSFHSILTPTSCLQFILPRQCRCSSAGNTAEILVLPPTLNSHCEFHSFLCVFLIVCVCRRGSVCNVLLTSCADGICRLWSETLLPEDSLLGGQISENSTSFSSSLPNIAQKDKIQHALEVSMPKHTCL